MYNREGDTDRVFSWPIFANKLLDPITLHVNDKITIRVFNSNQIYMIFNYHAEKYKINLTRKVCCGSYYSFFLCSERLRTSF